jgi:PAS domain S-box-containing protein
MAQAEILIVEDTWAVAEDIKDRLETLGYGVSGMLASGEEALHKVQKDPPDLVLMDIVLKGEMDGVEAAEQIRVQFDIPVVYLTAYMDEQLIQRAKLTEPFGYIVKPYQDKDLYTTVEIALYKHKMEKRLKQSEEWLFVTLRSIGDGVIATDIGGKVRFMNPVAEQLTGWDQAQAVGQPFDKIFSIFSERTGEKIECPIEEALEEGKICKFGEHAFLKAEDGTKIPIEDSSAPINGSGGSTVGAVVVFQDVREKRQAQKAIEASLKEKEVLLKEIHHRVKNNMQVIISLLQLQADRTANQDTADILQDSQIRVQSMALIHEQLYQSQDFAKIDFNEYVKSLVNGLLGAYGVDPNKIRHRIKIHDIYFDLENAVPCGLLINELVSNALKHAFPHGREGEIAIRLRTMNADEFELSVEDNGIGLPTDLDIHKAASMGMSLIKVLAEHQLNGNIEVDRTKGTQFHITFKRAAYKPRI